MFGLLRALKEGLRNKIENETRFIFVEAWSLPLNDILSVGK